jgi:hypothetical protein
VSEEIGAEAMSEEAILRAALGGEAALERAA